MNSHDDSVVHFPPIRGEWSVPTIQGNPGILVEADPPQLQKLAVLSESEDAEKLPVNYNATVRKNRDVLGSVHRAREQSHKDIRASSPLKSISRPASSTCGMPAPTNVASRSEFIGMSMNSMYPFHSELVDHLYSRPIVVSILIPEYMVRSGKKSKRKVNSFDGTKQRGNLSPTATDEGSIGEEVANAEPPPYINPTSPIRGPRYERAQNPIETNDADSSLDGVGSASVVSPSVDGSLQRAAAADLHQHFGGNRTKNLRSHTAVLRTKLKLFVVKIVDLIESREALYPVVVKDFNSLRQVLCKEQSSDAVNDYFDPKSLLWWMRYLKYLLRVFDKPTVLSNGLTSSPTPNSILKTLSVVIDKRLIRSLVERKMIHHRWLSQSSALNHGESHTAALQQATDRDDAELIASTPSDNNVVAFNMYQQPADSEDIGHIRYTQEIQRDYSSAADSTPENCTSAKGEGALGTGSSLRKSRGKVRKKKKKNSISSRSLQLTMLQEQSAPLKMRPLAQSYTPPLSSSRPSSREAYPIVNYALNHPSAKAHHLQLIRTGSPSNSPSRSSSRPVSRQCSADEPRSMAENAEAVKIEDGRKKDSMQNQQLTVALQSVALGDRNVVAGVNKSKSRKSRKPKNATADVLMQNDAISLSGESLNFSHSSSSIAEDNKPGNFARAKKKPLTRREKYRTSNGAKLKKRSISTTPAPIRTALSPASIENPTQQLQQIDQHHSPWEERYTYVAARSPRPDHGSGTGDSGGAADDVIGIGGDDEKEENDRGEAEPIKGDAVGVESGVIDYISAAMTAASVQVVSENEPSRSAGKEAAQKRKQRERFEEELQQHTSRGSEKRVANIISWARTAVGGDEKFRTRKLEKAEVKLLKSPFAKKLWVDKKADSKDILNSLKHAHSSDVSTSKRLHQHQLQQSQEQQQQRDSATSLPPPPPTLQKVD